MTPILLLALALQASAGGSTSTQGAPPPPPVSASAPAPAASAPITAPPTAPTPPVSADPVPRRIDDLSRPLTGAVPQGSYEAGVRGAFSRTQSLQGPLDGTWTLKDATGAGLYRVQLVDPGFGGGAIEGAWSDLRAGAAGPSGFFTAVTREGGKLTLQFAEAGAGLAVATLDTRPAGGFAGDLTLTEAGHAAKTTIVTLVRP